MSYKFLSLTTFTRSFLQMFFEAMLRRWSHVMGVTSETHPLPSQVTWGRGLVLGTTRSTCGQYSFFSSWSTWTSLCTMPTRGHVSHYLLCQRSVVVGRVGGLKYAESAILYELHVHVYGPNVFYMYMYMYVLMLSLFLKLDLSM